MQASEPSTTAKMTAITRGRHRIEDDYPWVLDDPFALSLVGPEWSKIFSTASSMFSPRVLAEARAFVVARSRYAEDRLFGGAFAQCVLLGAGLDSLGWRRPDLLSGTRLFEVDHPGMQMWKRERVAVLALPEHTHHLFVSVDFEKDSLLDRLTAFGFDRSVPTAFSWLGVVAYLTPEAIVETLRQVAACAPGSEITISYPPSADFVDPIGMEFRTTLAPLAASAGEAIETETSPAAMEELIRGCDLEVAEHLSRRDLHDRYFSARRDGLTPYTNERLIAAVVPPD